MTRDLIYLDNNATTKPDPRVVDLMLPFLREQYGNAASRSHALGWAAESAVEKARKQVASLIGCDPREVVWTSGATESDNLAMKGAAESLVGRGDHIITALTEHKAILDTAYHLERLGKQVTVLPVDFHGSIDLDRLSDSFTDRTILVSLMLGNNEIGTIHPVAAIGELCRAKGVLFHVDATQGTGKIPVDVERMQVDLMSLSAHKIYGPKGVGALYVRRRNPRVQLAIQMDGGGHERGMRSGTLNVPSIVGFGAAAELCSLDMQAEATRLGCLRDYLHEGLQRGLGDVVLNGHPLERLPGTVNLVLEGVDADAVQVAIPDVAVSAGSACTSATVAPSHVLKAIGRTDLQARSSLRFSLGRFNTQEEIDYVLERFIDESLRLRKFSAPRKAFS